MVKDNGCIGSYSVSGYTRSDGTQVSSYTRTCGAAHNSSSSSSSSTSSPNRQLDDEEKMKQRAEILYPSTNVNKKASNIESSTKTEFEKPVNGRISSFFGYRVAPTLGASTGHSGIDIAVPIGTPVKSIADGKVIAARSGMKGYGTGVFIDHGIINGKHVVSEYGHLNSYNVKIGDIIKQGQVIAKSGNTGISTGPHLHLTIREDRVPVDPQKYMKW